MQNNQSQTTIKCIPRSCTNLILDGHTLGAIQVVITDEAWDGLTAEQQDILMEAGVYASQFNREISEEAENEVLAGLIEDGVNVVEVTDIAPMARSMCGSYR